MSIAFNTHPDVLLNNSNEGSKDVAEDIVPG